MRHKGQVCYRGQVENDQICHHFVEIKVCKLPLRKRKQSRKTLLEVPRQLVICACVSRILFGRVQVLIIKT